MKTNVPCNSTQRPLHAPAPFVPTRSLPSPSLLLAFFVLASLLVLSTPAQVPPSSYRGTPYTDSRYPHGPQKIPGKVQCALYDRGGEGVAYHDTDAKNNGSGALNPADGTYLNEFRMHEGVDTSYIKLHDGIDNNPYNLVPPPADQLYVGWTEPGEWFKITVEVAAAGLYTADLLYTSNRGGTIAVELDGRPENLPLTIPSTFNPADPVAWRQWHHWNIASNLVQLQLPRGKSVLTIRILSGGAMNLAYFDFKNTRSRRHAFFFPPRRNFPGVLPSSFQ